MPVKIPIFKFFEKMVKKPIKIKTKEKSAGIKAWMGLCWPLGPVLVVTGNRITISQPGFEEEGEHIFLYCKL